MNYRDAFITRNGGFGTRIRPTQFLEDKKWPPREVFIRSSKANDKGESLSISWDCNSKLYNIIGKPSSSWSTTTSCTYNQSKVCLLHTIK